MARSKRPNGSIVVGWLAGWLVGGSVAAGVLGVTACRAAQSASELRPEHLAGRWTGAIAVNRGELPFAVTFSVAPSDQITAGIDIKLHKGTPLEAISLSGDGVHFELRQAKPATAVFDGRVDGKTMTGSFAQGRARGTFRLTRVDAAAAAANPPPYRSEEATFTNGAVTLSGTLTLPHGSGPFRAVVLVSGSGAQNRDSELFGFKLFATIADHLTRQGIAVLRVDDRGVAGSTGSLGASTMKDRAGDVLAGVSVLAGRPEIDRAHIGILGHSEGASLATMAAIENPKVGFLVMVAPPSVRGDKILERQMTDAARGLGATDRDVTAVQAAFGAVLQALRSNADTNTLQRAVRAQLAAQYDARAPDQRAQLGDKAAFVEQALPDAMTQVQSRAVRDLIDFDPTPLLASVHGPILALFGGKDVQVPPDMNRAPFESAVAKGGDTKPTVIVYPDANHLFMSARTGAPSEYASLPKAFVPAFLDDITRWVAALP